MTDEDIRACIVCTPDGVLVRQALLGHIQLLYIRSLFAFALGAPHVISAARAEMRHICDVVRAYAEDDSSGWQWFDPKYLESGEHR